MSSTKTQFPSRLAGALAAIVAVSGTAFVIAAGVQGPSGSAPHSLRVAYTADGTLQRAVLALNQPGVSGS
jgi:hypothetical protein